jgi:LPXTG-motif cell wall-anchored protein
VTSFCDRSATADVASALDVFGYYCSAAAGDVVAEVSESIAETYPTAESRTGSGASGPEETGGGGGGGEGGDGEGGGVNKTAIIAASILGGILGIALIVGVGFYVRRRKKKASRRDPAADPSHHLDASEVHDESKSNIAGASSELTYQGIVELPLSQSQTPELPGRQHREAYELPTASYEMDSSWRRG